MILKASQRAGGKQLARHLMNAEDNEHVRVHELRGFVSGTLEGAFTEAYAVSRGTKCQQFLFSLSLSPPATENVPVEVFEEAIARIERKTGLSGQPRAIVFHEKEGRRHAHCVWSRIDVEEMKAINLPHFKLKLRDVSRTLYIENNWKMPKGLVNSQERDPLNFTLAEWQQAKRNKQDPRTLKETFQDCWAISDSKDAFKHALAERGYYLAKGDRRGHVAVDWRGEVYAVSRALNIKAKEVRAKLGEPDGLPTVDETRERISKAFSEKLRQFADEEDRRYDLAADRLQQRRRSVTERHRSVRADLETAQEKRRKSETKQRAKRLPTGLKALWYRLTGQYRLLKKQNEEEAERCKQRDREEMQVLIEKQLRERRTFQQEVHLLRHRHTLTAKRLYREMGHYLKLGPEKQEQAFQHIEQRKRRRQRGRSRDLG